MPVVKSDVQVKSDVLEELKWDSRVDEADVGVEVDSGVVTLTGTVSSYATRLAAREAAHRVSGVLDVADGIQVKVPSSGRLNDTDLAQAVRGALVWDARVPEDRIRSTVTDGHVILEGEVSSWSQRADAEQAVRNLRGVKGVLDNIRVTTPQVDSHLIRSAIERALERRAVRGAKGITVLVDEGAVTLLGDVHDWSEEQAVLQAASHVPGVRSVKNELGISLSSS